MNDVKTMIETLSAKAAGIETRGGKYLSFFLLDEEYGIEILRVQEIIGLLPVTRVPRTPEFIRGVINLRGKIIAVMDLRLRFGMPERPDQAETCIVVVKTSGVEIGIIVDQVSEVLDIADSEIEDVPAFGTTLNTDYLLGVARTHNKVRLLLDINCILTSDEVMALNTIVGEDRLAVA